MGDCSAHVCSSCLSAGANQYSQSVDALDTPGSDVDRGKSALSCVDNSGDGWVPKSDHHELEGVLKLSAMSSYSWAIYRTFQPRNCKVERVLPHPSTSVTSLKYYPVIRRSSQSIPNLRCVVFMACAEDIQAPTMRSAARRPANCGPVVLAMRLF